MHDARIPWGHHPMLSSRPRMEMARNRGAAVPARHGQRGPGGRRWGSASVVFGSRALRLRPTRVVLGVSYIGFVSFKYLQNLGVPPKPWGEYLVNDSTF